jgi:hypothetical protein
MVSGLLRLTRMLLAALLAFGVRLHRLPLFELSKQHRP